MKKDTIIEKQEKVIEKKNEEIAKDEQRIEVLEKKVESTSRKELAKEVANTREQVIKNKKFNVKAWLLTSCFAIASCIFGLTNLIINIVDKVKN